ncbi:MAG TPA: YsnF/AvaK domain-containing protein [Ktedonobacterales bacterium]|nr:YsnF/AvaK domain-containing protein [Ktedonobacterales bacterium]
MTMYAGVLPGARVRGEGGYIGTVEYLEHHWSGQHEQPDRMIVRSDDGRWRYSIPLMFVTSVTQGALHPIAQVTIGPDELAHYIIAEAPRGATQQRPEAPKAPAEPATLRVPIASEELVVHKQPEPVGMAHVHKGVEEHTQEQTVSVYHEEAEVERIPAEQFDARAQAEGNPNDVIIPVVEERLVVHKESVVTEYIRVRKRLVEAREQVLEQVRREYVTVTQDGEEGEEPRVLYDSRMLAGGAWVVAPREESGQEKSERPAQHAAADDGAEGGEVH